MRIDQRKVYLFQRNSFDSNKNKTNYVQDTVFLIQYKYFSKCWNRKMTFKNVYN